MWNFVINQIIKWSHTMPMNLHNSMHSHLNPKVRDFIMNMINIFYLIMLSYRWNQYSKVFKVSKLYTFILFYYLFGTRIVVLTI